VFINRGLFLEVFEISKLGAHEISLLGWKYDLSNRAPVQPVQGPEFKPQYHKNKKDYSN
jgi:hypothetical protein